jgi:hypothetical protein
MDQLLATVCSHVTRSWYDFFKDFSPTFVATVFGAAAAWIAFNQWKTANSKLRFDLFEKRIDIYHSTKNYIAKITREGNSEFNDALQFIHSVNSAKFLFDKDISKYMQKIYDQSIKLSSLNDEYKMLDGALKIEKIKEKNDIFLWFPNQFDELDEKMQKYLVIKI